MVAWDVLASHEAMAAWHAGRLAAHAVDLAALRALRAGLHACLQADPDVSPQAHPPGPGEAGAAAEAAPGPTAESGGDARQAQTLQVPGTPLEGSAAAGTEGMRTPSPSGRAKVSAQAAGPPAPKGPTWAPFDRAGSPHSATQHGRLPQPARGAPLRGGPGPAAAAAGEAAAQGARLADALEELQARPRTCQLACQQPGFMSASHAITAETNRILIP
jgi:hypothetical protein